MRKGSIFSEKSFNLFVMLIVGIVFITTTCCYYLKIFFVIQEITPTFVLTTKTII